MNAVKTFREIMKNTDKVESINLKGFLKTGNIDIKFKNLTEQEEEDLNHLRMNVLNGAIYDDRERTKRSDTKMKMRKKEGIDMSMQLISEKLLEKEIKRLEDAGRPEEQEIIYCLCKKELAVIQKLKINKINMRGEIEEVNQRIEKQAVYFMDSHEFEEIEKKARKYDIICDIVKE